MCVRCHTKLQSFKAQIWIFKCFRKCKHINEQFYAHFEILTLLPANDVYDDDLVFWHIFILFFYFFHSKKTLKFIQLFTEMECLFFFSSHFLAHNVSRTRAFLNAQQQNHSIIRDCVVSHSIFRHR